MDTKPPTEGGGVRRFDKKKELRGEQELKKKKTESGSRKKNPLWEDRITEPRAEERLVKGSLSCVKPGGPGNITNHSRK